MNARIILGHSLPPALGVRKIAMGVFLPILLCIASSLTGCSKEGRKQRHLSQANAFFEKQQFEQARIEYLNVLRFEPRNALALKRVGKIYFDRGKLRESFPFLREAATVDPADLDIRTKVAGLYLAANERAAARDEAVKILDRSPTNEQAVLILSEASVEPAQIDDAIKRLKALQQGTADAASFHLALGGLASRRGDLVLAEAEFSRAQSLDPKSSVAQMALGNLALRRDDSKAADSAFQSAVELAPTNWVAQLKLAEVKLKAGQNAEAKKILSDLTNSGPASIPATLSLAKVLLTERQFEESSALIDRSLKTNSSNPDALLLRAQLALAKGKGAEAAADLEKVRSEVPKNAQVLYNLALAYAMEKSRLKAVETLRQAIQLEPGFREAILLKAQLEIQSRDFSAAADSLASLTTRYPDLAQAHALLGDAYKAQGKLDEALVCYRRWKELAPDAAQSSYAVGVLLRSQEKNEEARQELENAVRLAPDFVLAIEQLAELDFLRNDVAKATERANQLAARNPKSATPLVLLAKIHANQGALREAENDLLKGIELEPKRDDLHQLLAQLYGREKKLPQALEQLNTATSLNPSNSAAWLQAGSLLEQMQRFKEALASYEKVLELNPTATVALNNAAYLSVEHLNDVAAAYGYAQKARELAPREPAIADTFGWVLCRRGDFATAVAVLREASEKLSTNSEVFYHLGTAYYMQAEEESARSALQKACDINQNFAARPAALAQLEVLSVRPETADAQTVGRLRQRIQSEPADILAHVRLAELLGASGKLEEAAALFLKAVQMNPKSAKLRLALGRFYAEKLHDSKKALEQAKAAREIEPDSLEVGQAIGTFSYLDGDFKNAYLLLQDCARKAPQDSRVLFDLAQAAYATGRLDESAAALQRALASKLDAGLDGQARTLLEMISLSIDAEKAERAQEKVASLLRDRPDYLPGLAARGVIQRKAGQTREAIDTFESILFKNPSFAFASRQLAFLYSDSGRSQDQKVIEYGKRASEVFKKDSELANVMGRAAFQIKDYSQTVEYLNEGLSSSSNDAGVYYRLGISYCALQQPSLGKAALEKAISLQPNDPLAADARRLLAQIK